MKSEPKSKQFQIFPIFSNLPNIHDISIPDFGGIFSRVSLPVLQFRIFLRLIDPTEIEVRDLRQVDLIQNMLESFQVKVGLDLRLEHPDAEAETNDVDVDLQAEVRSPSVGFDQEGFDACLKKLWTFDLCGGLKKLWTFDLCGGL